MANDLLRQMGVFFVVFFADGSSSAVGGLGGGGWLKKEKEVGMSRTRVGGR